MIDSIGTVYVKIESNYHDLSNKKGFITKSKQDNDKTDHTSVISIEYDTKLSRSIRPCAVYDENKTRQ